MDAIDDLPARDEDDFADRVEVFDLVDVSPEVALAVVSTRCHRAMSGPYNHIASVVRVSRRRVELGRFAPLPRWARTFYEGSVDPNEVWGAAIESRDGQTLLTSTLLHRGIGDSGYELEFRLEGDEFVAYRVRSWGIDRELEHGARALSPIVAPPGRQCRPILEVTEDGHGLLRAIAGLHETRATFTLHADDCRVLVDEQIGCGPLNSDFEADLAFRVQPVGDDWVVSRIDARRANGEAVRLPRRCSLD